MIPKKIDKDVLFCSSVLNLSELLSLRPDLASIKKKIVYFHENQLAYPVFTRKVAYRLLLNGPEDTGVL